MTAKVTEITVRIGKRDIKLTPEDAESLCDAFQALLGRNKLPLQRLSPIPVLPQSPANPVWPSVTPTLPYGQTTCATYYISH